MNRILLVKGFAIALCSALVLLATACGPSHPSNSPSTSDVSIISDSSHPSEADGRAALEHLYNSKSEIVKVDTFKKTDGQDRKVFGAQGYTMSYEANSECTAAGGCVVCPPVPTASDGVTDNVYSKSYVIKEMGGIPRQCKRFDSGVKLTTHGKIGFAKSEKGWTVQ